MFSFFKDFFSSECSPEVSKFKSYFRYTVFLILLFAFFFALSVVYTLREAKTYQLINFKNRDLVSTLKWLQDRSLRVKVFEKIDMDVAKYGIISQDPVAGEVVKEGRTVSLVVSTGDQFLKMPNFFSNNFAEAENKVKALFTGYSRIPNVVKIERYSIFDEGLVVDQFPKAEENLSPSQEIMLVVSKGKVSEPISVENYRYQNLREVESKLINQGVKVKAKYLLTQSKSKSGQIINQSIEPGSSMLPGEEIIFEVSFYSDNSTTFASSEVLRFYQLKVPFSSSTFDNNNLDLGLSTLSTNSNSGGSTSSSSSSSAGFKTVPKTSHRQVQLVVEDAIGRHITFEGMVADGETIDFPYKTIGHGTLKVYLDKEPYESVEF